MKPALTITFTRLLSGGFGLLVLVGLGVLLFLGFSGTRGNTQTLLSELSDGLIETVVDQIDGQLQPVETQLEYLARAVGADQFPFDDKKAVSLLFEGALAATPQVTGLLMLDHQGGRVWVDRDQHEIAIDSWLKRRSERLELLMQQPPTGSLWLEPTYSPWLGKLVLPLVQPVYRGPRFVGLIISPIEVSNLSDFVSQLSTQVESPVFILFDSDQVLAHPKLNHLLDEWVDQGALEGRSSFLPKIGEIGDPALQQIWGPRRKQDPFVMPENAQAFTLNDSDSRLLYLIRPMQRYGDKPWVVGTYLDPKQIPDVFQRMWDILIGGLALVVVILLLVIWISRRIGAVVDRTVAGFDAVGHHPLQQVEDLPGSRIQEFNRVSLAFNRMLKGLRENETSQRLFGQYVPQAVAHELLQQQGELKPRQSEATVLFCDLEGFTRLSQQLEPSRLVETLNSYFSSVVDIIESHGGVVTQFQGDAVLAIFNVPLADTEHARKAWQAGCDILRRVEQSRFCDQQLHCRIGINSGELVAGSVGAKQRLNYTVHGDAVNLAARLESMNKIYGTRLLVSESTARQLTGEPLAYVAEAMVRGREGKVRLYTLEKSSSASAGDHQNPEVDQ
ncbi:adenylate/guanylate cyclase domain-containing protein [Motiliproteus coralliicola]|uniref:Adenylate/guanylate cyclase domain-containing protein n=1 Tax=Motiliproteus coralliicola TaxID=2283196 RepID=A0A369WBZ6_9GAMM|nr:adenylate/guanylate cyclase domain-containing protein [Motiliproteus coralliicola]RDE19540.1 adenylate/guanylate cyclase domain-containing protein [Motiliproteus coralliicola]